MDRDEMNNKLSSLMKLPFIKKESDEGSKKQLDLKAKLAACEKEIDEVGRNFKKNIVTLKK